jgi:hypothetical protein
MRILTAAVILAAASAGTAYAADGRLSDSQFVKAAHCKGLSGGAEVPDLDALIKAQKRGRSDHVLERAGDARTDGARMARTDAAMAQTEFVSRCAGFAG